ncbi:high-affinity choline transporter 1-like isoform X2 [Acropora palmata]
MRNREYFTMIDPFQERYGPRMGGLLYIPALLGDIFWSAAILNALGATISVIINVHRVPSIISSACVAVFYTLIGGLYSVTYTDIIQLSCIFIGLWISVPFAMTNEAVSSISVNSGAEWTGEIQTKLIGVWLDYGLLLIFGGIPWQAYFQRVLSCKTARKAQGLSFAASVGCVVLAIPAVLIGAIGASTDWKKTAFFSGDSINGTVTIEKTMVLPMVLQYLCPPVVSFIGLGAVSAAVMSSADSSILSASTICARNIYKLVFRQKASEKEVIWVMRISMFIVGTAATAIAISVNSIYTLFALCSDLVYVILFPQLCCVIHLPDANIYGSIMGYIIGLILRVGGGESAIGFPAFIKYPYYDEKNKKQLFPFKTMSMMISFITIVSVSYLTKHLFTKGILPEKYDFLHYFKRYDIDKTDARENENQEMQIHEKYEHKL